MLFSHSEESGTERIYGRASVNSVAPEKLCLLRRFGTVEMMIFHVIHSGQDGRMLLMHDKHYINLKSESAAQGIRSQCSSTDAYSHA